MKTVKILFFYGDYTNVIFEDENALWGIVRKKLNENGYDISLSDEDGIFEADYSIFFRLPSKQTLEKLIELSPKTVFYQWEPPVVHEFDSNENLRKLSELFAIFRVWDDSLVDNKTFFKFYYPMYKLNTKSCNIKFDERKLLTNISGNKTVPDTNPYKKDELYSKRVEFIRFMENNHPEEFDSYGMGWDISEYPSYGGSVESKFDTLEKYKFSICFENNRNIKGYVTEKIFDCLDANCVPIYWGADNVTDFVPKECFIDFREFNSYDKVYEFIKNMSEDEYNKYINAKNIYANSEEYKHFSYDQFAEKMVESIKTLETKESLKIDKTKAKTIINEFYSSSFIKNLINRIYMALGTIKSKFK